MGGIVMTKEILAAKLHGIEYRNDIPETILKEAKEHGFIIITGASDDLIEFEGAFTDEGSCYGGDPFYINSEGVLTKPEQDDYSDDENGETQFFNDFKEYRGAKKKGRCIVAEWCVTDEYSWTYVTGIPHAKFDVLEDGEKYCQGIVIDIKDLK